jgi:ATP-dependent RNA helicase DDX31/DBP7
VGAYSVHSKHLKSIFSVRSLHLGHVAGSFGLAEAPTAIGGSGSAAAARKAKQQKVRAGKGDAKKAMRKAAYAAMRNA